MLRSITKEPRTITKRKPGRSRSHRNRRLRFEFLEDRRMMDAGMEAFLGDANTLTEREDADTSGETRAVEGVSSYPREDVNEDGWLTPGDALALVNHLNSFGTGLVNGQSNDAGRLGGRFDVDLDHTVTPADVLVLINKLNGRGAHRLPPSVTASGATVEGSEGMAATNSGTFSGPSATTVAVTASVGTVTQEVGNRGRWIWSLHPTDGPDGNQIVTITASDDEGLSSTITFGLTVSNAAPRISADGAVVSVTEGQTALMGGIFSDPGDDELTLTASVGTIADEGDGTWSWSFHTTEGADEDQTVTITATDSDGAVQTATFALVVEDAPPVITSVFSSGSQYDGVLIGEAVTVAASFYDVQLRESYTATIDWDDGSVSEGVVSTASGSGSLVGEHVYSQVGVFTATLTISDGGPVMPTVSTEITVSRVGLRDGVLKILGTEGDDTITVRQVDERLHIDNDLPTFDAAPVREIVVEAGAGDDVVDLNSGAVEGQQALTIPVTCYGGPGRDTIYGGGGPDFLDGGPGDDVLYGSSQADVPGGQDTADTLVVSLSDSDRVLELAGRDNVLFDAPDRVLKHTFLAEGTLVSLQSDNGLYAGNLLVGDSTKDFQLDAQGRILRLSTEDVLSRTNDISPAGVWDELARNVSEYLSTPAGTAFSVTPSGELRIDGEPSDWMDVTDIWLDDAGDVHLLRGSAGETVLYLGSDLATLIAKEAEQNAVQSPDPGNILVPSIVGLPWPVSRLGAAANVLDTVGYIVMPGYIGSGVLLEHGGNRYVLTAWHVVEDFAPSQIKFKVFRAATSTDTHDYGVEEKLRIPGHEDKDIALLRLDRSVPDVQGARLLTYGAFLGERVYAIGFGLREDGATGIREYGPTRVDGIQNLVGIGSVPATHLAYRYDPWAGEVAIAGGDSGGPDMLVIRDNDRYVGYIAGVHSYGRTKIPRVPQNGEWTYSLSVAPLRSMILAAVDDSVKRNDAVPPPPTPAPEKYVATVYFDTLQVTNDGDGVFAGAGEWRFRMNVNGREISWDNNDTNETTYRLGRTIQVTLSAGDLLTIRTYGWEDDDGVPVFGSGSDDIIPEFRQDVRFPPSFSTLNFRGAKTGDCSYVVTGQITVNSINEIPDPEMFIRAGTVALRANNGQYLCAEGGGGREVVANRSSAAEWERFQVVPLGSNRVALRAWNGQYVCAEGGGGGQVVADRNQIGQWETFEVAALSSNRIALRTWNGLYVCAEGGGGRELVANRSEIKEWETFEFRVL